MDVFYYYYYLFYTRVLPDDEPHATTIFTLSVSEALFVSYFLDFIWVNLFCKLLLTKWYMIGIFIAVIIFNSILYGKTGKGKRVVTEQPKLFNNEKVSLVITCLFFLVSTSFLFWMADYLLIVIERCR